MKAASIKSARLPWLQAQMLHDGMAVSSLFLLVLLFVWPALLPGRVLMPLDIVTQGWPPWQEANQPVDVHNLMLTDVVNYIYPVKQFMVQAVRSGEAPLWNPYVFAGYPFTYNTQAGMFYPLTLLYYLLPGPAAVDLTIILQMFLGAWFMYAYLRQVRLRRLPSMLGTVVFLFNGVMVVWLEWQVVHAAIIWLPAQLYLVERIAHELSADRFSGRLAAISSQSIGLGILFAIPWLGGHWNWTLYTGMTLVVYMVFRLGIASLVLHYVRRRRQAVVRSTLQRLALPMTIMLLALGTGIALSLVQVLPAFNYLSQTHRQPLPFDESMRQGLFSRAVVLLIPDFFGSSAARNWWGPPYSNDVETAFYCGILALLLAGLALWLRRDRHTFFFAGWGGLTLLWALGTPLYSMLYILPVFNGLQPSRAAFIVTFCVAVLAALGADRLMTARRSESSPKMVLLLMVALLLVAAAYFFYYRAGVMQTWSYLRPHAIAFLIFLLGGGGLLIARASGRLRPHVFGSLALLWLVLDLFAFGHDYNTVGSLQDLYPDTPVAEFLRRDAELFRIVTLAEGIVFYPNTSLVVPAANISGYEPGILQRTVRFIETAEGGNAVRFGRVLMPLYGADSPLLAMANVKYILTVNERWAETAEPGEAQPAVARWLSLPAQRSFTMVDAGLHRLDLPLQKTGSPEGEVTVRVLSLDGSYEFAHATTGAAEIQNERWHSFFFSPFPSEWGRSFTFAVEFAGAGGEILLGADLIGSAAFQTYYLPRPHLVYEDRKTRIYLNEGYFSRAYVAPQARIVADEAEALAALHDQARALHHWVFLELEGQPPPPDSGSPAAAASQVEVTSYSLNRVILQADMAAGGFVVLSDTYYPGWQARINGRLTPIYRANSLLRAVYAPAGNHTIEFVFRPPDFIFGALISSLTLIACCTYLLFNWRRSD